MMLKPSIEELLRKVENRFALCDLVSKRARQLIRGTASLEKVSTERVVSAAINEIPDEGLFKIYPNPSDGYFIIESKNITPSEKVDIFIINSSGNLLLKSNIDNEYKIINLSSFAKGLYFYYIISKNKIYKSGTLIIK